MNTAQRIHAMVSAVCPVDGVGISDRLVRIDFADAATGPQRAAAQAVVDAFDWSQAAHDAWLEDQHPERKAIRQAATGAIQANDTFLAIGAPTATQVRDQVRTLSQQNNRIIRRLIQLD
jgi:hypothetical protein